MDRYFSSFSGGGLSRSGLVHFQLGPSSKVGLGLLLTQTPPPVSSKTQETDAVAAKWDPAGMGTAAAQGTRSAPHEPSLDTRDPDCNTDPTEATADLLCVETFNIEFIILYQGRGNSITCLE